MKKRDEIRAMMDLNYRADQQGENAWKLEDGPAGVTDLDDKFLKSVGGGSNACLSAEAGGHAQSACRPCQQ